MISHFFSGVHPWTVPDYTPPQWQGVKAAYAALLKNPPIM